MRNLTITRHKSFFGCLIKYSVYAEDRNQCDIVISEVPCKKLGILKNGETKNFEIGNEEMKIFVIADTLSKDYCNDYYPVPSGEDDLFISGQTMKSLFSANPFRFDGIEESEEVKKHRIKTRKKAVTVSVLLFVLCFAIGFAVGFLSGPSDKTFSCEEMRITLNDKFIKTQNESYHAVFDSEACGIFVTYLTKDSVAQANITSFEGFYLFARDYIAEQTTEKVNLLFEEGTPYVSVLYDAGDDAENIYTVFAYFESEEKYWEIEFVFYEKDYDDVFGDVLDWLKTVKFVEDNDK